MKKLFSLGVVVAAATVLLTAQQPPVITNVAPTLSNISPAYGGASGGQLTMTGTGFSTAPNGTRFVDTNGNDVFTYVFCSTTMTCQASARAGLVAPGQITTLSVHALVAGQSSSNTSFIYYGAPVINSLSPASGDVNGGTPVTLNGGAFTSTVNGFLGQSEVRGFYVVDSILANGCGSTLFCATNSGASPTSDCCRAIGAYNVFIMTPGGSSPITPNTWFVYGQAPSTPTITSINPSSGPLAGGNTVTVTGTNFITGGNSPIGGFGMNSGSIFTFFSNNNSFVATGVNCTTTSTCTLTVPAGVGVGGLADVQVQTVCVVNSPVPGCNSTNAKPAMSIVTTKKAGYTYGGIKVTPASDGFSTLYTSENGGTASFTVQLFTQPAATVHVGVQVSPNTIATPSAANLDFTTANWNVPQTVTITGLADSPGTIGNTGYSVGLQSTSTDANYNFLNASPPQFVNVDRDSKQVFMSPTVGLMTNRAGGTATLTVALTQVPSATVTVNFVSNDTTAGSVSPASMSFDTSSGGLTSWNTPRTLTITGANDGHVGTNFQYSVLVTISTADATYASLNLPSSGVITVTNTDAAPLITLNPDAQVVNAGAQASFTASASGVPAPTVQWQVSTNGGSTYNNIGGATAGTYAFVTAAADNGKAYRAVFTNSVGTATSNGAFLTVNIPAVPPAVTLNPLGTLTVLNGTAIFLSANATGSPTPTCQWQVSTNGGGSWNNFNGATSYNVSFAVERADNGKQYRAVFTNGSGSAASTATSLVVRLRVRADYDNDRKSDLVVWRPGSGMWFWLTSSSSYNYANFAQKQWGASTDITVSADMDGDGIADLIVWRPSNGTFYWLTSSTGYNYANAQSVQWGNNALNDVPFVADIDGDGKGDLIVWRPSSGIWFYLLSSANYAYANAGQKQWGNSGLGDVPILGDFDGDGLADFTVWRASTGTWFWLKSTTNYDVNQAGLSQFGNNAFGDIPMVGDMDGDGISDLVIWRPTDGNFYWLKSTLNYNPGAPGVKQWGSAANNDVPMLGDLDGDGIADLVIWRPASGTWFWLTSSTGYSYGAAQNKQWGSSANSDVPMMKGGIY